MKVYLLQKHYFIMLDVNKMCIMTSKFINMHFKSTIMFSYFSDERMTIHVLNGITLFAKIWVTIRTISIL